MNAACQGYAQARIQARFSRRPRLHELHVFEASRSVGHLLDVLRQSPLGLWIGALGPSPQTDDVEARLRARWRETCAEVSRWHTPDWAPAFTVFAAYTDLPGLELLRAGALTPPWLRADPRLGRLARSEGSVRASIARDTYGVLLGAALEGSSPLREAWMLAWRASWPATARPVARNLTAIGSLLLDMHGGDEAEFETLSGRLEQLFRRGATTSAASFAYLALIAQALVWIRGSHAALLAPVSR